MNNKNNKTSLGQKYENEALKYLLSKNKNLKLLEQNFKLPKRGGGEIDIILQDFDKTIIFIEVRYRKSDNFGGSGSSINYKKQQKIIETAQFYLNTNPDKQNLPCRFDVVLIDNQNINWIKSAFNEFN